MPDNTVIDGEVIALDQDGRPSFNALQNYGSAVAPVLSLRSSILLILAGRERDARATGETPTSA